MHIESENDDFLMYTLNVGGQPLLCACARAPIYNVYTAGYC